MIIRQLTAADDLSQAVDLLCRFFAEEGFAADRQHIARNTKNLAGLGTCGLFVAEAQGQAIGVATVSLEFGIEYGWWAEMGDLYVVPEHRGSGLSRNVDGSCRSVFEIQGRQRISGDSHTLRRRAPRSRQVLREDGV